MTDFNFDDWRKANDAKRAERRAELELAFARGLIVRQIDTFWSTAGVISTRHGIWAHAAFLEPYQSDARYLAEHLENRESGFGFETAILHVGKEKQLAEM